MTDKDELIAAFDAHVDKRVPCAVCSGTGQMTFGFRSLGRAPEPPKCPAPNCEAGWVPRP